jgi:hypothetical protein
MSSGCFGGSDIDRYMERQLYKHLEEEDSAEEPERDDGNAAEFFAEQQDSINNRECERRFG